MEPDAANSWLARVSERFPGRTTLLCRLALRDRAFRSLCEDYALARESLAGFQMRADAAERPEIADYRTVVEDLEREIALVLAATDEER